LLGASTRFGGSWSTDLVPLLTQSGARGRRDEAFWSAVEPTPGTYTFPAKYTNYLQSWQSNSLDSLLIADYGNSKYDDAPDNDFDAPYTDAGRTGFANYANALANQYPQVKNMAIWNEWDVNAAGPSNKTPDSYLALLQAAYTKLKANHPDLTVVGGGDAVPVDDATQAVYMARAQLTVPGHDVDRFYMYDFKNDGIDPAAPENNFGLVHNEADALGKYTPKPSHVAYATAARQLRGATFLGKEYPGNGLIDQIYATNDGTPLRAIWAASGSNTTVTVNATGPVQVTSLYGLTSTFTPNASGQVTVTVGVWPTYISGSAVASVTAP
jgi:hypothetical protein